MTKEDESAKAREDAMKISRKTLEDIAFQNIVGAGEIMNNQALYGQLAVPGAKDAYNEGINSDSAAEIRKKLQKAANDEAEKLGTYARPSINDYNVERDVILQVEENKPKLSLGDLGSIVSGIAGGFGYDFKVPDNLKDYVPSEIQKKVQEKAHEKAERENLKELDIQEFAKEVLTEEEQDAMSVYSGILSPSYTRGTALKAAKANYFGEFNKIGKHIVEKYTAEQTN